MAMPLKTNKKNEEKKETLNRNRFGNNYIQKYSLCGFSPQTNQEVRIFILNCNGSFPIGRYSNEPNAGYGRKLYGKKWQNERKAQCH